MLVSYRIHSTQWNTITLGILYLHIVRKTTNTKKNVIQKNAQYFHPNKYPSTTPTKVIPSPFSPLPPPKIIRTHLNRNRMIIPKNITRIKLPLQLPQPRQAPSVIPVKRLQRLRVRVVLVHVQLVVAAGALHLGADAGCPAVDCGRKGGVRVPGCEDAGFGRGG